MDVPYKLHKGDCLEIMPQLEAGSVDAIITDLPYGTTNCAWDEVIPLADMWREVKRLLKPSGAFITTSAQPFTSVLSVSNLKWLKYELIWNKVMVTNIAAAKIQPLRSHENILVFCEGSHTYNPQFGKAGKPFGKLSESSSKIVTTSKLGTDYLVGVGYPKSILEFPRPNNLSDGGLHPTQKPVALYEYLINTYTNFGETVLDITMGSGTTIIAAMKTGRKSIGIERDPKYFAIAEKRIKQAAQQPALLHEAQQSVHLTASGAGGRGQNPLQSSFIADDLPAKHGGR